MGPAIAGPLSYGKENVMEEMMGAIGNVGFPIAVSIYLLVRVESKMDRLTQSIQELSRVIEVMKK